MIEIINTEWQRAREIHQRLRGAEGEAAQQAILTEYGATHVDVGKLGSTYLPCFYQMKTSTETIDIGIPGINHNFIGIGDELYAIDNVDPSQRLGAGKFGQVFRGQNESGRQCAIKVEEYDKHQVGEAPALKKMGYLQSSAEIANKFYTVMDLVPGQGLMEMHKKGKAKDPWQQACKNLGYNLSNLQKVKLRFGYDSIEDEDDDFFLSAICQQMGEGENRPFKIDDIKALKAEHKKVLANNGFTQTERLQFVIAAVGELKKAFDNGILHRDIKGDNFVGQLNGQDNIDIALVDFGGAIPLSKAEHNKGLFGSPKYMAPEVLCALPEVHHTKLDRPTFARLQSVAEGPPSYSSASDLFSFAIMCEFDFGLPPGIGFGILDRAQELEPADRPSIEDIQTCLQAELLCQSTNADDKTKAIEKLRSLSTSQTLPANFVEQALTTLVEGELAKLHSEFSKAYKLKIPSSTKGLGLFDVKPTNIANMSMAEVVSEAQKSTLMTHRKRDVLMEQGLLDNNRQPIGILKTCLELESDLAQNIQNQQIQQ